MKIYLGFDGKEDMAYKVAEHSITRRASRLADIEPLSRFTLSPAFKRPVRTQDGRLWCPISDAPMSTDFAIARFAVPFLSSSGWALFADGDIVCQADIAELFALADPEYAVMVVQHPRLSDIGVKMDGQLQIPYARKNWSSVVLWNCSHPANKRLTRDIYCSWKGWMLHAFGWLKDEEIGALPPEWNVLVGVQEIPKDPKILHYTLGGPWCGVKDPLGAWDRERAHMAGDTE